MKEKRIKSGLDVCIVAVCYNAESDAEKLIYSIEKAFKKVNNIRLNFVLCDNSESISNKLVNIKTSFSYSYLKCPNIGYFPGFLAGLNSINYFGNTFDYTIVANVDLEMSEDFLVILSSLDLEENVGVIAPQIKSLNSGGDINPKIISRITAHRLKALRFIFKHYSFYRIHKSISNIRTSLKQKKSKKEFIKDIYAAHGSFIVFTRSYFNSGAHVHYPRFLFGEEVFVAEQARIHNLRIIHNKDLLIHDREHGSTGKQDSRFIANEHVKSYDFLIKNYFK